MTDPASEPPATLDEIESDLDGVARALARLEAGDYDRCEICGGPIEAEGLEAEPTGRRCTQHAEP